MGGQPGARSVSFDVHLILWEHPLTVEVPQTNPTKPLARLHIYSAASGHGLRIFHR